MHRSFITVTALLFASGVDGFKFMAKWKAPKGGGISPQEAQIKEQFGEKKLVVITGTSSGLGRKTAKALLQTGQYHVVGAVRDLEKMEAVAEIDEFDTDSFTPMHLELASYASVSKFCEQLKDWKGAKPLDRLICNAAVYQPSLPVPKWTEDGHEQQMQINFLSQFLMISKLLPDLSASDEARVVLVGSVTGNDNTVGGGGVYPIADLKDLAGLRAGATKPVAMFDGYEFDGAKGYKDSKLCLMMMSNLLHNKYHKQTGIAFSSIYPGCIAESPLFREKRAWFRKYFPIFMKFITGGFVSEEEAGQRLMQVAHDPRCSKSGVYWSWNGGPREGREASLDTGGQISGAGGAGGGWDSIYENDQSDKVIDIELGVDLFQLASKACGAEWPPAKQTVSPCPTLRVIGAITEKSNKKQDAKRRKQDLTSAAVEKPPPPAMRKGVVGKLQDRVLGSLPDEAFGASEISSLEELRGAAEIAAEIEDALSGDGLVVVSPDAEALSSQALEAVRSERLKSEA